MKKSLSKLQLRKLRKTLVKKGNSKSNISKLLILQKKLSVKYFNSPWVKGKGGGKFGKFRKLDFDGDGKVNMFDCYPFDKKRQDKIKYSTNAKIPKGESKNLKAMYIPSGQKLKEIVIYDKDSRKKKAHLKHEMYHHFYGVRGLSKKAGNEYRKIAIDSVKNRNKHHKWSKLHDEEEALSQYTDKKNIHIKRNERLVRISTHGMTKDLYNTIEDDMGKGTIKGYKVLGKHIYTRDEYQNKSKRNVKDYSGNSNV